jgi:hypothetical protein
VHEVILLFVSLVGANQVRIKFADRQQEKPAPPLCQLAIMYGPPPDCKRVEVERSDSLRKCIRPLSGRIALRALDDDPRVSVLINRSVTRDALSPPGFPTRRWTVVSSPSLLKQTLVERYFKKLRRCSGGKVESVFCFPSGASFPRPGLSRNRLQRLMSIVLATRQDGPGHTRQFVGDGHHDFIVRCTLS